MAYKLCVCVLSRVQLFETPWTVACQDLLWDLWEFSGKNTEWVAISSFRRSSWPRDWTHISCGSCTAGRFFTTEPPRKSFPHCSQSVLALHLHSVIIFQQEEKKHILISALGGPVEMGPLPSVLSSGGLNITVFRFISLLFPLHPQHMGA